jgi:hypothetical protein
MWSDQVVKLLERPGKGDDLPFDWKRVWNTKGKGMRAPMCRDCRHTWFTPPTEDCKDPVKKFRHEKFSSALEGEMKKGLPEGTVIEDWMYDTWNDEGGRSWRNQGK